MSIHQWPKQEQFTTTLEEDAQMKYCIGECINKWANLEDAVVILLATVLKAPSKLIAHTIYYTPTSAELRFLIVDNIISEINVKSKEMKIFKDEWRKIHSKIRKAKKSRNKVAHGVMISSTNKRSGKNTVRLASSGNLKEWEGKVRKRQKVGMSIQDVYSISLNFSELDADLTCLNIMLNVIMGKPTFQTFNGPRTYTFREIHQQLQDNQKKRADPAHNNQSPPEISIQPQSSPQ